MEVPQERTVIAGRYELESLIGEGGMGSVWRARDTTLARPVALKLLYARDDRDRKVLVERFLREARIAAAVQHRNVIHIVDFGSTEAGQPYMVMELLRGEPLSDRLARAPTLDAAEFINVAGMTLRGLSAVHDAGIIHRDLKPDNIFLTQQDRGLFPKILDFGISRSIEPASGRRSALTTKEGLIVGTPEYMSPEQARGIRNIDRRSDLYSMGVILYEGLTGRLPHQSENVGDLIIQIVTGTAEPVDQVNPSVPQAIANVVTRAMAHSPADRYQSAQEMQAALMEAADNSSLRGMTRPLSERPLSGPKPQRFIGQGPGPLGTGELGSRTPTLDGDLEFDIDEVDLSGRTESGETPKAPLPPPPPAAGSATHVNSSIPPAPSRRWPIAVAAMLGAGAVALLFMLRSEQLGPPAQVTPVGAAVSAKETAQAPEPPPAAAKAPEPELATLTLAGLPDDAEVLVDGEVRAAPLTFPRDGAVYTIAVQKSGMRPWQASYTATADATLKVALERKRASGTSAKTKPRPRKRTQAGSQAGKKRAPAAIRQLDF